MSIELKDYCKSYADSAQQFAQCIAKASYIPTYLPSNNKTLLITNKEEVKTAYDKLCADYKPSVNKNFQSAKNEHFILPSENPHYSVLISDNSGGRASFWVSDYHTCSQLATLLHYATLPRFSVHGYVNDTSKKSDVDTSVNKSDIDTSTSTSKKRSRHAVSRRSGHLHGCRCGQCRRLRNVR